MRLFAAVLLFALTGCYNYYHVSNANLHSEAERVNVSYVWDQKEFTIWISDSKKDLLNLKIIPGTAFIWTDFQFYRLIPTAPFIAYNGRSSYDPRYGRISSIGFYMKLDDPRAKKEDSVRPLKPDIYNISMQFNGEKGIQTLCGSFRIVKELKTINGNDLH